MAGCCCALARLLVNWITLLGGDGGEEQALEWEVWWQLGKGALGSGS